MGDIRLIDLLEQISRIEGVERIRLGSLEPGFITEDVLSDCRGLKISVRISISLSRVDVIRSCAE